MLKSVFVYQIALRSAIYSATHTRSKNNHVYKESVNKKAIIDFWKSKLLEFVFKYKDKLKNRRFFFLCVKNLKNDIDSKFSDSFEGNGIRIAQCHKSLSVFLKWLWCCNLIDFEPPVCPIDRTVLNHCRKKLYRSDSKDIQIINKVFDCGGWGRINDIQEYKNLDKVIQKLSKREELSPSVWELSIFNESF